MANKLTLNAVWRQTVETLKSSGTDTAELDATLLMEAATGFTALDRLANANTPIDTRQMEAVQVLVARRIAGEPTHRIIGYRDFYGLRLSLNDDTLVPRPDTETLVDLVLPTVHDFCHRTGKCSILDLGTGTGALALALLAEEPRARATGTDISDSALAMARQNARDNGLGDRFATVQSDWFNALYGKFDVIVSNPPYIVSGVIEGLQTEVRDHDPHLALDGGKTGLDAYRSIATSAHQFLTRNGCVGLEIGHDQRDSVTSLFSAVGYKLKAERRDYGGNDRALLFTL